MDVWTTGLKLATYMLLAATLAMPNPGGSRTEVDICKLPKDEGVCKALIPKWWFDDATGACEEFNYGGCGGNPNKFASENECLNKCPARPGACSMLPSGGDVCLHVITTFCTGDCLCCEHSDSCNPNPLVYTKDPATCP